MSFNKLIITGLIFFALFSACNRKGSHSENAKVQIKKENGIYTLYRNGNPFKVKGAGGHEHLDVLKEMGGNTIRVWDTTGLKDILDDAYSNDIAVVVGLPIPDSKGYMSFYNDAEEVSKQYQIFKAVVNRYKSHPAVLMWCLGNEIDFPSGYSSSNFYKAFNDLTDMIHQDDPDHPITTSLMYFGEEYITNIQLRCDLDALSFNIFGSLPSLRKQLKETSWIWDGPFILTEWGVDGPWVENTKQTAWGAFIEDSSKKKAEQVLNRHRDIPFENSRMIGDFIFYWGEKQELTPTWFSLFDEHGGKSELVSVMNYLWTNKQSGMEFPNLEYMLVNGKGSRDNVILDVNSVSNAELIMSKPIGDIKTVEWQILKEDWSLEKGGLHSTKKLQPIKSLIQGNEKNKDQLEVSFVAPNEEGPYRIYAKIYNSEGDFSTCNTPFYVVNAQ